MIELIAIGVGSLFFYFLGVYAVYRFKKLRRKKRHDKHNDNFIEFI